MLSRDLPLPQRRDIFWFGTLLGAALGLRATGLLMVGYVLVVIILRTLTQWKHNWRETIGMGIRSLLQFVPALALGYVITIASWPWASLEMFNPVRAIFAFAHFHYPIRTILDGHVYLMSDVPPWYQPDYLAIKLPLILLIGAGAAILWAAWAAARGTGDLPDPAPPREIGVLLFVIAFPLSCQIVGHGPSFTGMRHFLFVVPPIAVLAGIGAHLWLSGLEARGRAIGLAAVAAISAAFVWDAVTLVRLHPYEYLFYNIAALRHGLLGQYHAGSSQGT